MRSVVLGLLAATIVGGGASAAVYDITFTGKITSQTNPGADANLSVGDVLTFTAHIDDQYVTPWRTEGYLVAATQGSFYSITAPSGLVWSGGDRFDDAFPWLYRDVYIETRGGTISDHQEFFGPAIGLQGGRVLGLAGLAEPAYSAPFFDYGSQLGHWVDVRTNFEVDGPGVRTEPEAFQPFTFGANFSIYQPEPNFYFNDYVTPGFTGEWDFAHAKVYVDGVLQGVPEPQTWALLILGFAGVGVALRSRRLGARPT
jgi:hypothetical protein